MGRQTLQPQLQLMPMPLLNWKLLSWEGPTNSCAIKIQISEEEKESSSNHSQPFIPSSKINSPASRSGAQIVTEEVLRTVLIEIEGILNSKPLGYISSDVADPYPVTPNCLLLGRWDASLPQVGYDGPEILGRRRWRDSQIMADHFWKYFIKHYLPGLQARQKWRTEAAADLQVGDIVMIIDNQLPRVLWPVGKVTQVFPGADNQVGSTEMLVKDRTYTRPVARLISLPALPEEE
ncbi:hypothetical protein AAFF_G00090290 [Aldrovandia affinis]|uniref:DUF5641 domain-containing protein n=1 Tax=Aldrovandia affinis TaxID=143900 RepID=A0AAD7RW56_9TELE|nr:hypothetical protein AAFF_G00090290 [Aldrovandia affinis]